MVSCCVSFVLQFLLRSLLVAKILVPYSQRRGWVSPLGNGWFHRHLSKRSQVWSIISGFLLEHPRSWPVASGCEVLPHSVLFVPLPRRLV